MKRSIAVVCSKGIGDGLLSLVLSNNLLRAGYQVTTFSSPLMSLRSWFPSHTILPFPTAHENKTVFENFDQVIVLPDKSSPNKVTSSKEKLIRFEERTFNMKKTMIDNLVEWCTTRYQLISPTRDNGIVIPPYLKPRRYKKRVILHPMSSDLKKNWLPEKFLALATELAERGWSPIFMMSGEERNAWQPLFEKLQTPLPCPLFSTLSEAASYLSESAYLIGNDSGLGHLASNLQLPTLTLFSKKTPSHFWRPSWEENITIVPPFFLIGGRLREKKWKQALSVNCVLRHFEKLCTKRKNAR